MGGPQTRESSTVEVMLFESLNEMNDNCVISRVGVGLAVCTSLLCVLD